jgi:hypothetical protein
MKTRDDFQRLYDISNRLANAVTICFWTNAAFAFLTLVIPDCVKLFFGMAQVILALVYVALTAIDECFLWYEAEIGRIKDNIANAFSISLTEKQTEGYYTNDEAPSIKKYAINTYESAFYSREELKAMKPCAIVKIIVAVIIVLLMVLSQAADMAWILWVAQTMFSSVVVIDSIKLIVFSFKMNHICEQFYTHLITGRGITIADQEAIFISCVVEYETTKMYFKVRLSQKIFENLKPKMETEWKKLLSQIK